VKKKHMGHAQSSLFAVTSRLRVKDLERSMGAWASVIREPAGHSSRARRGSRIHRPHSNGSLQAGFWDEFKSDWFCLDCELMPWSAKARELIQRQYAAVGAAGVTSLEAVVSAMPTKSRRVQLSPVYERRLERLTQIPGSVPALLLAVVSLADYRLAPFHLLAQRVWFTWTKRIGGIWEVAPTSAADPGFIVATPVSRGRDSG